MAAKSLYIEDNPANMRLVERIVKRRPDLELLTADEPHNGLQIAFTHKPDIILLDISLPGIDGYEVLHRLRMEPVTESIPVIAISANAMKTDVERGSASGFASYLTKPIDINDFYRAIDHVLKSRGDPRE